MTERPILYTPDNIAAIYDGRKTQTRRMCTSHALPGAPKAFRPYEYENSNGKTVFGFDGGEEHLEFVCKYGRVGDRLWIREVHYKWGYWVVDTATGKLSFSHTDKAKFLYGDERPTSNVAENRKTSEEAWHKRSPLFMEKKYARKWLVITDIRVERLNNITDAEAIKEGVFFTDYGTMCYHPKPCPLPENHGFHQQKNGWSAKKTTSDSQCLGNARMGFANLWNSINGWDGPKSWDANPYVWVIEFEVVK